MKPTLVVLAAGMASRYGGNKQTDSFGPNGETIIDYSIFDAIRAGFGKVVFIIREEFKDNFDALFASKLRGKIEVDYAFQPVDPIIPSAGHAAGRQKPWGTAHAVMCAKPVVHEPFCVINADDFYGEDAFKMMADFLVNKANIFTYGMIGYRLGNTLSENGSVSRGVCQTDSDGNLIAINERTKIYRDGDRIVFEDEDGKHPLSEDAPVSMNFWGFTTDVFAMSEKMFDEFAFKNLENPKAEFFIPLLADAFIKKSTNALKVIPTSAQWFGVTYKEDKPVVQASLDALVASGVYPSNLWG